jgi:hypothetical protein
MATTGRFTVTVHTALTHVSDDGVTPHGFNAAMITEVGLDRGIEDGTYKAGHFAAMRTSPERAEDWDPRYRYLKEPPPPATGVWESQDWRG